MHRLSEVLRSSVAASCSLLEHGFTILHINDQQARGLSLLKLPNWTGKLPEFEEVTSENLKYDLEDARKLQVSCLSAAETADTL